MDTAARDALLREQWRPRGHVSPKGEAMLRLVLLLLYLLAWSSTMPQTDQGGGSADPLGGPNRPSHGDTDGGGGADPLG